MIVLVDVSIVITNYNYSKYLNRSIRSAFVQNYPTEKYELIIVDDSSNDWSKEIIDSYGKLVKKIYLNENVGLPGARNRGIENSNGKYVLFLDADDYLSRDIVFIESKFLDLNDNWGAVSCDYYIIDDNEVIIGRNSSLESPIACGIMFRKNYLLEIGMYDESLRVHEDRDLNMRYTNKYEIGYIQLPLYRYRKHDSSLSQNISLSDEYLKKLKIKHNLD